MKADPSIYRILHQKIEHDGYIDIPSQGVSMFPFIKEGYICRFEKVDDQDIQPGEVVLFESMEGSLVGHRLIRRISTDIGELLLFKGDSNRVGDSPIPGGRILGRLSSIRTGRGLIQANSRFCKLWGWIVVRVPLISRLIRIYLRLKRKWRGLKLQS